jgi:hypothetical protein
VRGEVPNGAIRGRASAKSRVASGYREASELPRRLIRARALTAALEVDVERVDELAEDLELLLLVCLGFHPGLVQDFDGRVDPDAGSDREGKGVGGSRVDSSVAWNVSSLRLETITRRTLTPSSSSVLAKRSCVRGRSGVTPWSRVAIAFASHGPIQMGR